MKNELPIILGTSSKFRRSIFAENFNEAFTYASADIDEAAISVGNTPRNEADPGELTLKIAHAKADALLSETPKAGCLLLTSDQVVAYDGRIREKPKSKEECKQFLRSYCENCAQTVTAVVVTNTKTGRRCEGVDVVTQHFGRIAEDVMEKIVNKGEVMKCAGGIMVEDVLLEPFLGERNGDLDSFMGLPVKLVRRLLFEASATSGL